MQEKDESSKLIFYHELLDRLYTISVMYDELIVGHDDEEYTDEAILTKEEKNSVSEVLSELYQLVGDRIGELYEGKEDTDD